jgi:acyl-CoA thioesterase-2
MTFDELFTLRSDGPERWIAEGAPPTDERMVFGGLVVGQAIVAASQGARRCHALHAYFIGMGAKQKQFEIAVERTRDGGSFNTRRVEIRQEGKLLMAALTSHHDGDDGPEHQATKPKVAGPEKLEDLYVGWRRHRQQQGRTARNYLAEQMLEVRPVTSPGSDLFSAQGTQAIWFRPRQPITGTTAIHQAAIGFASDVGLVRAGLQQHSHPGSDQYQTASLDHALWFHRDVSANDWMLHVLDSPAAANGRGFSRAAIYTRDGSLVASVAQEFLVRKSRPKA